MSFEGCVVFKILCSNVQVFMSLRKNKILKFEQLKKFSILYYAAPSDPCRFRLVPPVQAAIVAGDGVIHSVLENLFGNFLPLFDQGG